MRRPYLVPKLDDTRQSTLLWLRSKGQNKVEQICSLSLPDGLWKKSSPSGLSPFQPQDFIGSSNDPTHLPSPRWWSPGYLGQSYIPRLPSLAVVIVSGKICVPSPANQNLSLKFTNCNVVSSEPPFLELWSHRKRRRDNRREHRQTDT